MQASVETMNINIRIYTTSRYLDSGLRQLMELALSREISLWTALGSFNMTAANNS